ncbi:MAG: site-specific DNA-methyltransferase, partial [Oligoflexia bacterium]|nr:site-specific DNA-methyltransferase [Oligoflexia bacterium]
YNTGNAFEHYDDAVEHSTWLSLMRPRLELLKILLAENGIIFISIDDEEYPYLRVICDEVFGRGNFCGSLIWEKKKKPSFLSNMGSVTEYVLSYSRNKLLSPNFVYGETTKGKKYPFNNAGNGIRTLEFPPKSVVFSLSDQIIQPKDMSEGKIITKLLDQVIIKNGTNDNTFRLEGEWRYSQSKLNEIIKDGELITISKEPFRPNHIKDGGKPKKMKNLLSIAHYNMSTYEDSTKESIALFGNNPFDYPKPEKLIHTLISSVTEDDDLIIDSFLGSGTTCAVAQKMGRKYIGIEMGEHAYTHCKVRMDKVIDGSDQGGISKAIDWKGGGAYKFYELAPSFITKDEFGNPVIDGFYNDAKLIKAMCKLMNFTYQPSFTEYWKHGLGQGKNYLYVTTQLLTVGMIQQIVAHLGPGESLIICPKKYEPGAEKVDSRVTIKKIPQSVLKACHFGKKEYLLPIKENALEEIEVEEGNE